MRRLAAYALVLAALLVPPAWAQEDSGGYLVKLLEENLSGENRYIRVTGLDGALSSRASIEKITVSDDDGVWMTITNAVLDWNRLALVRGNFSVNELTAREIVLARRPTPTKAGDALPRPEATPFQLPEFPVAINIGEITVDRLVLAKPVIGVAGELEMTGRVALADGALDAALAVSRLDRQGDGLDLIAGFENETGLITLDLLLAENADGLLATALGIPGRPPIRLSARGTGPVDDFVADIALASDGAERLAGQVSLRGIAPPDGGDETPRSIAFAANLAGDVTALLEPEYQVFFGPDTRLDLTGRRDADGRVELSRFDVTSDALILNGALDIAAGGALQKLLVQGRIAPPRGAGVVLPVPGARTAIQAALLSARFDATTGNRWELTASLDGLERPDLTLKRAEIMASGNLDQATGLQVRATLSAALKGLAFEDPGLRQAIGDTVALGTEFTLGADKPLQLTGFFLNGTDYSVTLDGQVDGLSSGLRMQGDARIAATDLSRFSTLAGRPASGAIIARIRGGGAPLSGSFDFELDAQAQDLAVAMARIDPLIGGRITLTLAATRNENGLQIRDFSLEGEAVSANATGTLRSRGTDLRFAARLDDLARVTTATSGPLTITGDVVQNDGVWGGQVRLEGPEASFADLSGAIDPDGDADLVFDATLARIERFAPELSGTLTAQGSLKSTGQVLHIDSTAKGPAGIAATIAGTLARDTGIADLTGTGQVQLSVVNRLIAPNSLNGLARFDLALRGRPGIGAIRGNITTAGATIALPAIAQTLTGINGDIALADGRAQVSMTAGLRAGGRLRVSGPVDLAPPFNATLTTDLQQLVLSDNISFDTTADGQLTYAGPLSGNGTLAGQVTFGEANINIAAVSGTLGAAPIPPLQHRNEPGAVHATRARAGLVRDDRGNAGPVIGLDIDLIARDRVFARGLGLQAELGGRILLRGTTADIDPTGRIELIRGNMDILGRRLKLSSGQISLQGRLEPYIEFAATTTTTDGSATMEIAGPVSGPEISIYSSPDRPREEALAMLIFGNQYSQISPFALAQMAASMARLGSRGADGDDTRRGLFGGDGNFITNNVYTDITTSTQGDTELNLNLDVTENVTIKGTVDNTGDTAVGLFFERDY